jgi:hypothetical protein
MENITVPKFHSFLHIFLANLRNYYPIALSFFDPNVTEFSVMADVWEPNLLKSYMILPCPTALKC